MSVVVIALFGLLFVGMGLYFQRRRVFGHLLKLPPVLYSVVVVRNMAVLMSDGTTLLADRYMPNVPGSFPTILIRSPWARNLGTGEPIDTTTRMVVVEQTIYHDREHSAALIVPVVANTDT